MSNFAMKQHHNWSLAEMDALIPWEKEIYAALLTQYLEDEKMKHQQ